MERARILIVEDDAILAAHLEKMLEGWNYEISGLAATGEAAIRLALESAQKPDAILMDIQLRGEMDGIHAAIEIHKTNNIPVVFLTAYTEQDPQGLVKNSEAYACLTKPVRDSELHSSLEMALYKHAAEQRLRHLNLVMRAMRDVNQMSAREHNPQHLLELACEIIARTRDYRFIWIGQPKNNRLELSACAGQGRDLIEHIFQTASPEQGRAFPGTTAAHSKQPVTCHDMPSDARYAPWRDELINVQFSSTCAIPMLCEDRLYGVLNVYTSSREAFSEEEVSLLQFMAEDLALGLKTLEEEKQRKLAERKLLESEQRFQALIEKAADMILVIDAAGIVQFASPTVEKNLGYKSEEIVGKTFLEWLHQDDLREAQIALASRSQKPGTAPSSMTVRVRHKNGEWRFIEALGTNLLAEPAIEGIVLNFRDVTAARLAEEQLRQRMLELSGLNEMAKRVNRSLSVHEVINAAVDEIIKAIKPDAALFFTREGENLILQNISPASAQHQFGDIPGHRVGECLCGLAIQQGRNLYSRNIFEDVRCLGRECKQAGMRSFAAIPLRKDGATIGVLGLASNTERDFEQQATFLDALIRHVSIALENATLYETAQREIEEREKIAIELGENEEKFRSVIEQSADGIVLADEDGTIITWNSGQETITGLARKDALGKKMWDVLFQLGPEEFRTQPTFERLRDGFKTALANGLSPYFNKPYENTVVHPNGERREVQTLAFIISSASGNLSGSISRNITEKKKSDDMLRRQLSELEVLYENSLAINRLLEPAEIGQKLLEILADKLDWHHATIRRYHAPTGKIELLALSNPSLNKLQLQAQVERLNNLIHQTGQGLSGWAIQNKQAVRCARVNEDPRYIETYSGIQSGLYVPIRSGDDTIGVISVESEHEAAFTEQDERLLATLANQAAIAIQNAELYTLSQQELTERKRAEEQLRQAHAGLEQRVRDRTVEVQDLYDNAPCGYHSVDASGLLVHINKTELDWLGYAENDVIGRPLTDFLTSNSRESFANQFPLFKKSGLLRDAEMEFIRKNGSNLILLMNSTAIFDENGDFKLSRSTLLDISQRKQTEQALLESEARLRQNRDDLSAANLALEKAARLKDEFLASMSHELRTPLTGILGLSEAMQLHTYGDLSDKQLRTLKNIENSGRHLLDLINDILDLSKIEAGKLDFQFEPCSLNDICQASLQLTKGIAQQKQQDVSFSMQPASIVMRTDKRRLKQMLVNLLANAVKFTPDGGALGLEVRGSPGSISDGNRISSQSSSGTGRRDSGPGSISDAPDSIGAWQDSHSAGTISITVWDKGIGIKAEDLPRLFKPFEQLDSSLSRRYAGTGLGLSLVQRMAELHGGSVQVESTPGQGSRFTLVLPWEDSLAKPLALKRLHSSDKLRALTIDPQVIDTDSVSRYLHSLNIENKVRTNTELIVEYAAVARPDLILLELNLPARSGLDVLAELKADERTRAIAVIMMSVEEKRGQSLALGAAGYLVKPFSQADLTNELERVFSLAMPHQTEPLISAQGALILVADDNEENLQMLEDFLKSRNFSIEKARNGLEMLALAAQIHPAMILVDIQMPEMDGLEAIRRIRAHLDASLAATPIIAITALAMPGDRDNCLSAGANDYLSKPLELGRLVESINKLLN